MFPGPYGDFQGFMQMWAFQEIQDMKNKTKRERKMRDAEDLLPLKRRFWFCLNLLGCGLGRLGRSFERIGQRLTWYALHKKAENVPDYYR